MFGLLCAAHVGHGVCRCCFLQFCMQAGGTDQAIFILWESCLAQNPVVFKGQLINSSNILDKCKQYVCFMRNSMLSFEHHIVLVIRLIICIDGSRNLCWGRLCKVLKSSKGGEFL